MLKPDIPCLCKQCRSRSVGFFSNNHVIWIKQSDWLSIQNGHGILIHSACSLHIHAVWSGSGYFPHTIFILSFGTDRPAQIRHCRVCHLIRVYTSIGSKMNWFKVLDKYGKELTLKLAVATIVVCFVICL